MLEQVIKVVLMILIVAGLMVIAYSVWVGANTTRAIGNDQPRRNFPCNCVQTALDNSATVGRTSQIGERAEGWRA